MGFLHKKIKQTRNKRIRELIIIGFYLGFKQIALTSIMLFGCHTLPKSVQFSGLPNCIERPLNPQTAEDKFLKKWPDLLDVCKEGAKLSSGEDFAVKVNGRLISVGKILYINEDGIEIGIVTGSKIITRIKLHVGEEYIASDIKQEIMAAVIMCPTEIKLNASNRFRIYESEGRYAVLIAGNNEGVQRKGFVEIRKAE